MHTSSLNNLDLDFLEHKCKIWNLYISPTCFCHSRNKTFILSWNKIHQLCHSEVVLLISCGLYPEDCIPLISSLQFLFIQIATWEGKRWGVRLGCLLALAEKGYSSWWELLWCFSRTRRPPVEFAVYWGNPWHVDGMLLEVLAIFSMFQRYSWIVVDHLVWSYKSEFGIY